MQTHLDIACIETIADRTFCACDVRLHYYVESSSRKDLHHTKLYLDVVLHVHRAASWSLMTVIGLRERTTLLTDGDDNVDSC